jgi:hypothetical protein
MEGQDDLDQLLKIIPNMSNIATPGKCARDGSSMKTTTAFTVMMMMMLMLTTTTTICFHFLLDIETVGTYEHENGDHGLCCNNEIRRRGHFLNCFFLPKSLQGFENIIALLLTTCACVDNDEDDDGVVFLSFPCSYTKLYLYACFVFVWLIHHQYRETTLELCRSFCNTRGWHNKSLRMIR